MLGDWKIQLIERPGFDGRRIYLWRRHPEGTQFLKADGSIELISEGNAVVKDTEMQFAELNTEQITALANTLAEQGFKTESGSKIEGQLESTTRHLNDMRRLVFESRVK